MGYKNVQVKFGVNNYKLFTPEHNFDLLPITVVTGPNSSGKSSLRKVMELIHENFNGGIPNWLELNDLDILNFNNKSETFKLKFPINEETFVLLSYGYQVGSKVDQGWRLFEIELFFQNESIYSYANPPSKEFPLDYEISSRIKIDKLLELIEAHLNSALKIGKEVLHFYENIFRTPTDKLQKDKIKAMDSQKKENIFFSDALASKNALFRIEYLAKDGDRIKVDDYIKLEKKILREIAAKIDFDEDIFNWLDGVNNYKKLGVALEKKYSNLNHLNVAFKIFFKELHDNLEQELSGFIQEFKLELTPWGKYVRDEFWISMDKSLKGSFDYFQNIAFIPSQKSQFENIFDLRKSNNFLSKCIYNFYLWQTGQKNGIGALPYEKDSFFGKFKSKWLKKFEIGQDIKLDVWNDSYARLTVIDFDGNEIDIANMGYGVGQVISLILIPWVFREDEILTGNDDWDERAYDDNFFSFGEVFRNKGVRTLSLEEPEINLHPNWQSLIMDLFADINKTFKINFIIETHSEYLIRKLQYLVANNEVNSDDCKILYFKPKSSLKGKKTEGDPVCYDMILRPDGIFANKFGEGFTDESSRLTRNLFKIQNNS